MCCINTAETPETEDRKEIIMKKQLKKTVSLGLAAVMALGLTACGGGSSSSDSTTAPQPQQAVEKTKQKQLLIPETAVT